ncbi:MAG: GNAT family N-acetyltransferase [Oceanospirillales bacterium]|nr:GNAT family N-acetyltransferase [Oceanospirillales bacterium]
MRPIHFERYGMCLDSLQQQDIERVRQWRNDPKISSLMLDQTHITQEMQQRWFERMSEAEDQCYLLARFKGEPVGVGSLIAIDPVAKVCEPGLYVYPDEYRGNIVPFCLAFALNDLAFERFELERLYARVLDENIAAIRFNQAMGYEHREDLGGGVGLYSVERGPYIAARDKIARFIRY